MEKFKQVEKHFSQIIFGTQNVNVARFARNIETLWL